MGKLILIILIATVLTAIIYTLVNRVSSFKNATVQLTTVQKLLCYFIVLYVPIQLFVLLTAGSRMPLGNLKGHDFIAISFTLSHALMSVMGMVVSNYFQKKNKAALALLIVNASTAIFYFMAAIIFITK